MSNLRRQPPPPLDPWTAFLPPRDALETPPSMSLAGGSLRPVEARMPHAAPRDRPRPGRPLTTRRCLLSRRTFSFACTPGVKSRDVPLAVVRTGELASVLLVIRLHEMAAVAFSTLAVVVQEVDRSPDDPGVLFLGSTLATVAVPTSAPALERVTIASPPPHVQLVLRSSDFGMASGFQVAAVSIDLVGRYR